MFRCEYTFGILCKPIINAGVVFVVTAVNGGFDVTVVSCGFFVVAVVNGSCSVVTVLAVAVVVVVGGVVEQLRRVPCLICPFSQMQMLHEQLKGSLSSYSIMNLTPLSFTVSY